MWLIDAYLTFNSLILISTTAIKSSANYYYIVITQRLYGNREKLGGNIMNMPKPIYESLPILYVVGGVAAISTVDSFMSFISGILLGSSGVMILLLRRNYRNTEEI